jgi:hypothetical protein
MRINYIITAPEGKEGETPYVCSEATTNSVTTNLQSGDTIITLAYQEGNEESMLNDYIAKLDDDSHVVVINDGSILRENAWEVYRQYDSIVHEGETKSFNGNEIIKLPIVELSNADDKGKLHFKGFLNASLWKPYFAETVGELDSTLATRGVDLMLYGALIPTSILKKYKLKTDLKYYSFFEFLSRMTRTEIPVLGIPKITLKCVKDYELKDVPQEEKLIAFKAAQAASAA